MTRKNNSGKKKGDKKPKAQPIAATKKASATKKKTVADNSKKAPAKKAAVKKGNTAQVKQRAENRYNLIRKAASNYCKQKYGKRCDKATMDQIYQELKNRFFDVKKSGTPGPAEVANAIEKFLGNLNQDTVPIELRVFPWYDLDNLLRTGDGLFFRDSDKIILQMFSIELEYQEVVYNELHEMYMTNIKPAIKGRFQELKAAGTPADSPPPEFVFDEQSSDPKKRVFVYQLEVGDEPSASGITGGGMADDDDGEDDGDEVVPIADIEIKEPKKRGRPKKSSEQKLIDKLQRELDELRAELEAMKSAAVPKRKKTVKKPVKKVTKKGTKKIVAPVKKSGVKKTGKPSKKPAKKVVAKPKKKTTARPVAPKKSAPKASPKNNLVERGQDIELVKMKIMTAAQFKKKWGIS